VTNNLSNKGRDEKCFRIEKARVAVVNRVAANKVVAARKAVANKALAGKAAAAANSVAEEIGN